MEDVELAFICPSSIHRALFIVGTDSTASMNRKGRHNWSFGQLLVAGGPPLVLTFTEPEDHSCGSI